ncbi:metal-dependent hydrolase [Curtobacterium sp. B8]|uniref:metal-dependent hydrolase n=1 Tax=Curtobacterium sp. B8 TaxID=95611 RepID=UPI000348A37C|nr:metal-dependent hydrolase [Curtobacterium sp. B8]
MAAPMIDTEVTYPAGAVTSEGTVVHVEPVGGDRWAIFLDRTAAHPVDTAWPDQPADRVTLSTPDAQYDGVEVRVAGVQDGTVHVGDDLPVRTGTEGWVFAVAHVVHADPPALGDRATVTVDREFRTALSVAHSACHLAALALDAVLADRWSKPVPEDSLGRPAFDSLAIVRSSIGEYRSEDVYRIGKSLRKKGFDPGAFDDADGIADRVTGLLRAWTATGGPIHVVAEDSRLSARRQWRCELPDGVAAIPCGGTHPDALSDLVDPTVAISVEDVPGARVVTMTTTLTPR